jgi:hypothetical protein
MLINALKNIGGASRPRPVYRSRRKGSGFLQKIPGVSALQNSGLTRAAGNRFKLGYAVPIGFLFWKIVDIFRNAFIALHAHADAQIKAKSNPLVSESLNAVRNMHFGGVSIDSMAAILLGGTWLLSPNRLLATGLAPIFMLFAYALKGVIGLNRDNRAREAVAMSDDASSASDQPQTPPESSSKESQAPSQPSSPEGQQAAGPQNPNSTKQADDKTGQDQQKEQNQQKQDQQKSQTNDQGSGQTGQQGQSAQGQQSTGGGLTNPNGAGMQGGGPPNGMVWNGIPTYDRSSGRFNNPYSQNPVVIINNPAPGYVDNRITRQG